MKRKYITYGCGKRGSKMYVVSMYRTPFKNWKVKVEPCDVYGSAVFDAVAWEIFDSWFAARRYFKQQYREFDKYVNSGR